MNKQIEALKMAIEAIEYQESLDPFESSTTEWNHSWKELHKALIICKEALAEAEKQEPVAWMEEYQSCKVNGDERLCHSDKVFRLVQLLASQSKEWQSLSDDDILNMAVKYGCHDPMMETHLVDFARAVRGE